MNTEPNVYEVGVDATHFWFFRYDKRELVRCPHAGCGGSPELVATTEAAPLSLLVEKDAVYWATGGALNDGGFDAYSVWRLAK